MKTLHVGVAGAGMIGDVHARLWAKIPGVKVVGVVDKDLPRAKAMGEKLGVPAFSSVAELKRKTLVQVVSVCVPSGLHVKVALDAVREGLHVYVEKPIDIKVSRALELIRAAKRKGVRLAVSSQKRFTRGSLQIRQWVKAGKLGKIFLSRAIVPWYRSQHYYDMGGWRGTLKMDGGGALINQSIHMLDLMLHMTGKKAMAASAACGAFTHKIEAEDTLVGHLRMSDGSLGQILAATSIYPGFADRVELYGEKGCAIWEGDKVMFSLFKSKKVSDYGITLTSDKLQYSKQPSPSFEESFLGQLKPTAEYFRSGKGSVVTAQSAAQTLAVIEAIYKSARHSHKEEKVQQI